MTSNAFDLEFTYPVYAQVKITMVFLQHFKKGVEDEFLPEAKEVYADWMESSRLLTFLVGPLYFFIDRQWDAEPADEAAKDEYRKQMSSLLLLHQQLRNAYSGYRIESNESKSEPSFSTAKNGLMRHVRAAIHTCNAWMETVEESLDTDRRTLYRKIGVCLSTDERFRKSWAKMRGEDVDQCCLDLSKLIDNLVKATSAISSATADELGIRSIAKNVALQACMASRLLVRRYYFLALVDRSQLTTCVMTRCHSALAKAAEALQSRLQAPEVSSDLRQSLKRGVDLLVDRMNDAEWLLDRQGVQGTLDPGDLLLERELQEV